MGLLGSLFGKKKEPASASIRDTLFADMPPELWPPPGAAADAFPWDAFAAARAHLAAGRRDEAVAGWRRIVDHPGLEPRHYLQAWHFLRQQGLQPPPATAKQVLGVVVEVGMPKGLDMLAAYPDHSARYYNFSGAGVVWEHPDTSLDAAIDALLAEAAHVVAQIGPWDKERPGPPQTGSVRLSFLTPSGLHFGQGGLDVISRDPKGGRLLQLATELMQAMIGKTK
ncbi:MAG: hypothetical protein K1X53_07885 [Candidatus Sumerlaeaceae bacterium]|nr:hypothetical protein [Candidatus Sumerlaeaceae bacterium]